MPKNSLTLARLEACLGIYGTYYFRAHPESWDEKIIREVSEMGHEIGYHYEDVSFAAKRFGIFDLKNERELIKNAVRSFSENLEKLRSIAPVKTICMHGSPLSKWDSRLLWKYHDYKDFGIIGEPYFDIDFDEILYLTDTARRWDGEAFSIRDKTTWEVERERASGRSEEEEMRGKYFDWKVKPLKYRDLHIPISHVLPLTLSTIHSYHSTFDIINASNKDNLPEKIMLTLHPQRWTDRLGPWVKELVWQNVKNQVKLLMVRYF
jgi:hypothetical protein